MTRPAVLILGGRSDIGLAIAHRFAALGHPIQLAAREAARLEADRSDIALRHRVPATLHEFDVLDTAGLTAFLDGLGELPGVAICVVGVMGEQGESEARPEAAALVMRSTFEGPSLILGALANRFEARGSGTLVGVSSVAGERGRRKNYVYGSAKAGLTAFLSGLRNRLAPRGIHVVTVLPGFVATRMTRGMVLPARLTASPDEVAAVVERAVARRRDVVYVRPVWRLVMAVIRGIPESRFKRMDL